MKSLFFPLVFVFVLIMLFVILDRKEFNRYNSIQKVQKLHDKQETALCPRNETRDRGETRSQENNTETNPVAEIEPVADPTTATETRIAEIIHVANPPIETKSVAETKPVEEEKDEATPEKLVPFVVPVATTEEAIQLNEDAMIYVVAEKEKREPFYSFYQDTEQKSFCFQGTIRATSTIPDPEKNDYDNCLYALFVEIDSLLSDIAPDTQIACEAIVNAPIMKNKKILQDNIFLPGDKIWCTCTEYDTMPQAIQEIQLSDDIQSYEHQQFYSIEIRKVSSFQKEGNRNFAKREITILPIQTIPKDEKAIALRKERIQKEITRIEEELKKHGGSFEKWKEDYIPIAEKYKLLSSQNYKGWINDSFFAAGGSETQYDTIGYIQGITPYKKYLENNNIDLILVRIPSKVDFAARVLASDDFQENPAWVEHYYECLKNDIEIIDPMPEMWKHRFDFPLFYFYHVPKEIHPLEGLSYIASKTLAEVLKRYNYPYTNQPITLEDSDFRTTEVRYLWPEGNEKFNPEENIVFKQTNQNGKPIGYLAVNTGSPFLFLSNSFFAYPQRSLGASVPGYTAFFLQHIPDWDYQDGTENQMIRNLISNPQLLACRKAVIMVGFPGGWGAPSFPKIPKYILDDAKTITLEKTLDLLDDELLSEGKENYVFLKEKNGSVSFVRDNSIQATTLAHRTFYANLSIPPLNGKSTCMIRLNFDVSHFLSISVLSKDNSLIDKINVAHGTNKFVDFFVPISNSFTDITLRFVTELVGKTTLKNIELWYY